MSVAGDDVSSGPRNMAPARVSFDSRPCSLPLGLLISQLSAVLITASQRLSPSWRVNDTLCCLDHRTPNSRIIIIMTRVLHVTLRGSGRGVFIGGWDEDDDIGLERGQHWVSLILTVRGPGGEVSHAGVESPPRRLVVWGAG